jgi:hypothetical protein
MAMAADPLHRSRITLRGTHAVPNRTAGMGIDGFPGFHPGLFSTAPPGSWTVGGLGFVLSHSSLERNKVQWLAFVAAHSSSKKPLDEWGTVLSSAGR